MQGSRARPATPRASGALPCWERVLHRALEVELFPFPRLETEPRGPVKRWGFSPSPRVFCSIDHQAPEWDSARWPAGPAHPWGLRSPPLGPQIPSSGPLLWAWSQPQWPAPGGPGSNQGVTSRSSQGSSSGPGMGPGHCHTPMTMTVPRPGKYPFPRAPSSGVQGAWPDFSHSPEGWEWGGLLPWRSFHSPGWGTADAGIPGPGL